jgi:fatty acid desaturase
MLERHDDMRHTEAATSPIVDHALRQARKELLRELAHTEDRPTAMFLSRYCLTLIPLIFAGSLLAWWTRPVTLALFAIIAGFTQNALGILMHEGSHHFFHRNRKTNDLIANMLVCLPIFNTVQGYRDQHFEHHRHSGEEIDPYHDLYGRYATRPDVFRGLIADVIGMTAIRSFLRRYVAGARPTRDDPRWTVFALLGEQAVIAALLWRLTGSPLAWVFLWVLPLTTIPFAINRVRTIAEHYPGFEALPANRTTLVGIIEYCCIAPYGYSHHFEHHFAPNVPYYRLAWAHSYLKDRGIRLRSHEYNSAGYLQTFTRVMTELGAGSELFR